MISVLGLQCPDPVNSDTTTARWNDPVPLGFQGGLASITYSYNGNDFTPTPVGSGAQSYSNFPVGRTTNVRATATHTNGNVATCVFFVTVAQPTRE